MIQNPKNRKAAVRSDSHGQYYDAGIHDDVIILYSQTQPYKAEQPNAANGDGPDPDPVFVSQPQVSDGVDDSQEVLHAGEVLEESLSIPGERKQNRPHFDCVYLSTVESSEGNHAPGDTNDLHDDHVVGEAVRVAHSRC